MKQGAIIAAVLCSLCVWTGCGDEPGQHDDNGADDWTYDSVMDSLEQNYECSDIGCHGDGMALPLDYDLLIDVESECDGTILVIPGDAEGSFLWQKITPKLEAEDVCGNQMPPGTAGPVSEEAAQMVADWIDDGAPK